MVILGTEVSDLGLYGLLLALPLALSKKAQPARSPW